MLKLDLNLQKLFTNLKHLLKKIFFSQILFFFEIEDYYLVIGFPFIFQLTLPQATVKLPLHFLEPLTRTAQPALTYINTRQLEIFLSNSPLLLFKFSLLLNLE
jgi:hypothetical protein